MVRQLSREEYENKEWWKDTMSWIENIPKELDSKKPVPKKGWKVFEADSWAAARDAARRAAWDAAWDTAWDAARDVARGAAWDAARGVAGDAAGVAAGDAARDAARDATGDAAWNAAWDAALLARIKICDGLGIDKKHVKHAEERWEANKRGYRVWCDVGGMLCVYRKKVVGDE